MAAIDNRTAPRRSRGGGGATDVATRPYCVRHDPRLQGGT